MGYREHAAPAALRPLVECIWTADGTPGTARVLPDGCMDLLDAGDGVVVAGPDTEAFVSRRGVATGVRFRPGILPRLLGVPAAELRNTRVPFEDVSATPAAPRSVVQLAASLAAQESTADTSPWSLSTLAHVTGMLRRGAEASAVADELGCTTRTLQRHCTAAFGYGPATLRRILRFRAAVQLIDRGMPKADVAAETGYADQPHLHREVRALAGVPLGHLSSGQD